MSETEKNRQIVQEGLDKRKAERKAAEEDARQEKITMQMINMVNKNAHKVDVRDKMEINRATYAKKKQKQDKKIASILEKRDVAIEYIFLALICFAIIGICYVTEITKMWNIIAATILTAIMFIVSSYFAVMYTIKLA